jgi:hypothetical protein
VLSVRFVKAVLDGPPSLDGGKLKVMIALAEWAGDDGLCWYSVAAIAKRARLKERATQYVLQQLAAEGYLHIEEGRGRTHPNRYIILMEALEPALKGATILAPFSEKEKVQKVQNIELKGAKSELKGATAIAPEPLTTIKPSGKRARAESTAFPLPLISRSPRRCGPGQPTKPGSMG